jgi:hypothetical protein
MELPIVEVAYDAVLAPGVTAINVGTLLSTPAHGTTASVQLSYAPQAPFPSGVVSFQTSGVAANPQLDLRPISADPWSSLFILQAGDVLYASSTAEVKVTVRCLIEPNPGGWKCAGCATINPAGRLICTGCREPRSR